MQQETGDARHHSKCYGYYTAVKKVPLPTVSQSTSQSEQQQTRRRSSMPTSYAKVLLMESCIFCPLVHKTINRKVEPLSDCLSKDGRDSIYANAHRSSNERVKALVHSRVDLIAKEAQYHKSCRRDLFKQVVGTIQKKEDVSNRQLHSAAFGAISVIIERDIFENSKAMLAIAYGCVQV